MEEAVQYVLLIYGDPAATEQMSEQDGRAMMAEYLDYTEGLRRPGAYVSGGPARVGRAAALPRGAPPGGRVSRGGAAGIGADGDHGAAARRPAGDQRRA